jgi:hypothetical protein
MGAGWEMGMDGLEMVGKEWEGKEQLRKNSNCIGSWKSKILTEVDNIIKIGPGWGPLHSSSSDLNTCQHLHTPNGLVFSTTAHLCKSGWPMRPS